CSHGGKKCLLNQILRDVVLADTFESIPIENIAVFIDPERGITYGGDGQLGLGLSFADRPSKTSGLKRHYGDLSAAHCILERKGKSLPFRPTNCPKSS